MVCSAQFTNFQLSQWDSANKSSFPEQHVLTEASSCQASNRVQHQLSQVCKRGEEMSLEKCLQHCFSLANRIRWEFLLRCGAVWPLFIRVGCGLYPDIFGPWWPVFLLGSVKAEVVPSWSCANTSMCAVLRHKTFWTRNLCSVGKITVPSSTLNWIQQMC